MTAKQQCPKLSDLKVGMHLKTDGGFLCLPAGQVQPVRQDKDGLLFICCGNGRHYLDGQVGTDGRLIGLTLCPEGGEA